MKPLPLLSYSFKGNSRPALSKFYQMLDPLEMLKKTMQICEDFEWAPDS